MIQTLVFIIDSLVMEHLLVSLGIYKYSSQNQKNMHWEARNGSTNSDRTKPFCEHLSFPGANIHLGGILSIFFHWKYL